MRTALEAAHRGTPPADVLAEGQNSAQLLKAILHWMDEAKAENVVTIDLHGKSSIGDFMVIASGRSDRHVAAVAEQLQRKLKETGFGRVRAEGLELERESDEARDLLGRGRRARLDVDAARRRLDAHLDAVDDAVDPVLVPHGRPVAPEVAEARERELEVVGLRDGDEHARQFARRRSRGDDAT